ncbi:MAG TPA: flagellar FlbD family protein [Acidimicrobiia bacterium]|jgi:flagellar protein FlbD|nr:flagellar FlbD family protein [Acidimicrobiia bacterium]
MIILTRLNGEQFAINCDLVERVDAHPNTVLTLVDATKYIVAESLTEVVERVRDFRASVLVRSAELQHQLPAGANSAERVPASISSLRLVNDPEEG